MQSNDTQGPQRCSQQSAPDTVPPPPLEPFLHGLSLNQTLLTVRMDAEFAGIEGFQATGRFEGTFVQNATSIVRTCDSTEEAINGCSSV